jgi:hypothetical protein
MVVVAVSIYCCWLYTQGNEDKDSLNDTVQSLTQKLKAAEAMAAEARAAEHKVKTQHEVCITTYFYIRLYTIRHLHECVY